MNAAHRLSRADPRRHDLGQHVRPLVDGDAFRRLQAIGLRARPFAARDRQVHGLQDDLDELSVVYGAPFIWPPLRRMASPISIRKLPDGRPILHFILHREYSDAFASRQEEGGISRGLALLAFATARSHLPRNPFPKWLRRQAPFMRVECLGIRRDWLQRFAIRPEGDHHASRPCAIGRLSIHVPRWRPWMAGSLRSSRWRWGAV